MSEWEDCPFCGGKGPFTESTNHRLGCPHGDLIDELALMREALQLILPMARGYALAHPVGSNQKYVEEAEALAAKEAGA